MRLSHALLRLPRALWFLVWFAWQLAESNVLVAWEVVTPRHRQRPGIIRVPIESRTDLEITLLANLISLTPGTLTLELATDLDAIYVHFLHVVTKEETRLQVREMERRLLRLLR